MSLSTQRHSAEKFQASVKLLLGEKAASNVLSALVNSSRALQTLLIGYALLAIACCQLPDWVAFDVRVASLHGASWDAAKLAADAADAVDLAGQGLFLPAVDAALRCFCCGRSCPDAASDVACTEDCPVRRLLTAAAAAKGSSQREAERFHRSLADAWSHRDSPGVRLALGFGFTREDFLLAAVHRCCPRHHQHRQATGQSGGGDPFDRAGSVVDCLQEFYAARGRWSSGCHRLPKELLPPAIEYMAECAELPLGTGDANAAGNRSGGVSGTRPSQEPRPERSLTAAEAEAATAAAEAATVPAEDASSSCRVCRTHQLSRLCLPCRHLVVCGSCFASCRVCPKCSTFIIGSVQAFLT